MEGDEALSLRLGDNLLKGSHQITDFILEALNFICAKMLYKPRQQVRDDACHPLQDTRRRFDAHVMSSFGEHQ